MKKFLFVALLALLLPALAAAQNVVNPGTLVFTASEDHAILTGYIAGFFLPGAAEPFLTVDIGKPIPDASGQCVVTLNTRPVKFGTGYTVKLMSLAEGVTSEWSTPSNPFDRKPGPPTNPVLLVPQR
jgi:opacity protein-like surface antigen